MSWNFILLIFINKRMSGDESSLYSRINSCPEIDGELLRDGLGIIKTMHTGWATRQIKSANALGADTEETGRYDLAWKDLCGAFWMLSSK